jgi:multimeric flavodoxin WrbA
MLSGLSGQIAQIFEVSTGEPVFHAVRTDLLQIVKCRNRSRIGRQSIIIATRLYDCMPPKIIALLGSPRTGGNTAKLLGESIRGAEDSGCEVEKVIVPFLKFKPCMEIFYCIEHENCRMEDDITPFYEKFKQMDGLIIAAPIMTMGIPGALKSFMDRFQVFYMAKYWRHNSFISEDHRKQRKTLFISIGGMNIPNDFDGALLTVEAFCEIIDCPLWGTVLRNDMDTIQNITTRPDVMKEAYDKAYEMCSLIAKKAG